MADGKKSFLLYSDQIHIAEMLDDETAGKLLKMIFQYVNDQNPITDNLILKLAFEPIKQQLKRDLKDWESEKTGRVHASALANISRWHPEIYKQIVDKQINVEDAIEKIKSQKSEASELDKSHPKASESIPDASDQIQVIPVNVNVTVNDTVTDKDNTIPNSDELVEGPQKEVPVIGIKKPEEPKKKVARKKKGNNPDSEPYWKAIRFKWIWFNKTHLRFDPQPIPERDYSHMHRIIEKLRERSIGQAVEWTEKNALDRWEKFLTAAYTKDDWLGKNFLLGNLESKMQKVFNIIENPNGGLKTHSRDNSVSANSNRKMEALAKWGLGVPKDGDARD